MKNKKSEWERDGLKNKHHLTPKSRGGNSKPSNLLVMDMARHNAWHFLFGNLNLDEVIALLKRLKHLQKRKGVHYETN